MIFAIALGLPAGVIAGGEPWPSSLTGADVTALVGYSMPIFWWACCLIIVLFRATANDACVGAGRSAYYFPNPTGFTCLIDSLASGQKRRVYFGGCGI